MISSVLSYISSISAISETINNTSDVAADYVAAALQQYIAVAYETGSIARLADPERTVEEKEESFTFFFLHNSSLSEPPLYMNNHIMPYFAANHKRYVPGSTLAPV